MAAAEADEPPTIRDGYHHVAWSAKDGAPVGIWTITQTTDGWLWLGSGSGLSRFDGVSFERIDLLPKESLESRSVRSVLATRDGGLWVVYANGRTAFLPSTDRSRPTWVTGVPVGERIDQLHEDGAGHIWGVTATSKLYLVADGAWHSVGASWDFPTGELQSVVVDAQGALWVSTSTDLGLLRVGYPRFERPVTNWTKGATLGASQGGRLWTVDAAGYRLLEGAGIEPRDTSHLLSLPPADGAALLARDGSWWSVDCPSGVCRAWPTGSGKPQPAQQFERDGFTRLDGLSSDRPMIAFEDREGSIWIGTKQGLDQFRKNDLTRVHFASPLTYFTMAADPEAGIWTGTDIGYDGSQNHLWKLDPQPQLLPKFSAPLGAVFVEPDGNILFGGTRSVWMLADGNITRRDVPVIREDAQIRTLAKDDAGHLWASFLGDRTYRLDEQGWIAKGGIDRLHDGMATVMARDHEGQLWMGFPDNVIARVRAHHVTTFTAEDGLDLGPVTALSLGSPVLVGGEFGVDMLLKGRFVPLRTDRPDTLKGISGITVTRSGDLWIYGSAGAVRITATEFQRATNDPAYRAMSRLFDADDGLPAGAQQAVGAPSVIEDKQSRLWFASADGLAWLRPYRLQRDSQPPVVQILGLSSGQNSYKATPDLKLASGSRDLDIRYTALSLKIPSRVQFRFRLLGIDKEWRAMGTARSVSYINLAPGTYTAQVIASNDSGVWNEEGARLRFSIEAAFYQTLWFKALCAAAALLGLLAVFRLQSLRAASRAASRMRERMQERERIARELHDTLLQDIQALGLNLRALHLKYGTANPVSAELARLDEAAHRSMNDARTRVTGLRVSRSVDDLAAVFREFGDQLAALYPARLSVECRGNVVPLHSVAADEIQAIGREALLNAFRHSGAQSISTSITYGPRGLDIVIEDDGSGFSPNAAARGDGHEHWGIHGMRERAESLKADLSIQTVQGEGTRVSLRVPARTAFGRP